MVDPNPGQTQARSDVTSFLDKLANIRESGNSADDYHQHMRRRLLVTLSLLFSTIVSAAIVQRYIEFGGHPLTWSMFPVVLITISPLVTLRIFDDFIVPAKVLCLGGLAALALLTYMTEGIASPTLAWVAAVPLFATFIVSTRFGLIVGIVGSFIILAFFFLAYYEVPLPPIPNKGYLLGGRLISLAGLSFSIGFLGLQFERERKRALASSLQRQTDFRVLIEDSPAGIAVLDDNKFVYANSGLSSILALNEEDLSEKSFIDFAHKRRRKTLANAIRERQVPSSQEQATFDFVRNDGENIKLGIDHISEIEFNGDRRTLVMLRDLSERTRLEAQLRITDRLASVCSLAAGMAHEINNPIAFIKGNLEYISEILEEKGLDKELSDVQAAVFESIEGVLRVATIVQDMQSLAKIQPKESSAMDLSATVHSAIKLTNHATKRRATLEIDVAENLIVVADAANLHQILINLLINAAESMSEKTIHENTLRIYCGQKDEHNTIVEIHDSGPGIPESKLVEVFDPFYTTKDIGQGTGLGLSSSRQLVAAMQGSLELENHPDGGLLARITLPSSQ